jgi:hypothetical protein
MCFSFSKPFFFTPKPYSLTLQGERKEEEMKMSFSLLLHTIDFKRTSSQNNLIILKNDHFLLN